MNTPVDPFHMDKTKKLKISDQIMFRELEDESVLLNLHDESYYTLNSSGTFIWNLLERADTIEDAYQSFKTHYKLPEDQAALDFNELIKELLEKKFCELESLDMDDGGKQ